MTSQPDLLSGGPLDLLSKLIKQSTSRERRFTELLRDPDHDAATGWFMCVPRCFNAALDIQSTERVVDKVRRSTWTQGSSFSFSQGDSLYDVPRGEGPWFEALQRINLGVQIKSSLPAQQLETGERFSGELEIAILIPDQSRSRIQEAARFKISQDDFVAFLISGPKQKLSEAISAAKAKGEN